MINGRLSDDFIALTTKLMMAQERNEIIHLAAEFNSTIERLIEAEKRAPNAVNKMLPKSVTTTLKFTKQEISKMATTFKKEFIGNGLCARITKRESGKNSYCYEIRYRSNGYNISASSTDLTTAKKKFLAMTVPSEIEKYHVKKYKTGKNLLEEIFDEWYQYKKGTITDKELSRFYANFYNLPEKLRKTPILAIRTVDVDKVLKDVKPRKFEELRTLFNGIFKYAVASGILLHNPVALIKFKRAERQSRGALSVEEIQAFLERVQLPEFEPIRQGAYLLYFFGLRPCEVDAETRIDGDFLITRNRKRKNGKIEYKKIPVPKQAQGLIDCTKPFVFNCSFWKQNELFKYLFGEGKTAYCLRHTFATVCQQYVRPDIVDIWMGDSPQRLVGKVYTHFSDDFMRSQMDLVTFPIK